MAFIQSEQISDTLIAEVNTDSSASRFGFILGDVNLSHDDDPSIPKAVFGYTNNPTINSSGDEPLLLSNSNYDKGQQRLKDRGKFTSNGFELGFLFDAEGTFLEIGNDETDTANFTDYSLDWGIYSNGSTDQISLFDQYGLLNEFQNLNTSGTFLFTSAPPAYNTGRLAGFGNFDTVLETIGHRSDGESFAPTITGSFTLNLVDGDFTSTNLIIAVPSLNSDPAQEWRLDDLNINIAEAAGTGVINMQMISGTVYEDSDGFLPEETFSGYLSGFAAQGTSSKWGFVAGFNLFNDDSTNAPVHRDHLVAGGLFQTAGGAGTVDPVFNYNNTYRTSSPNFSKFGLVVSPDGAFGDKVIVGNVSPSSTQPLLISFAGSGGQISGEELFVTSPDYIFESTSDSDTYTAAPNSFAMSWNQWDMNDDAHLLYDSDIVADGGSGHNPGASIINNHVLMSTLIDYAAMSTGSLSFSSTMSANNVDVFGSTISGVTDIDLSGDIFLNFGTGQVEDSTLKLDFTGGDNYSWLVEFNGILKAANDGSSDVLTYFDNVTFSNATIADSQGTTSGSGLIDGDIAGLLADDGGVIGLNGGFNLYRTDSPSDIAYGIFFWQEGAFATTSEISALSSASDYGILATASANGSQENGLFGGATLTNSDPLKPLISNKQFNTLTFFDSFDASAGGDGIFRQNTATVSETTTPSSAVTFGKWIADDGLSESFLSVNHAGDGGASTVDFGLQAFWFVGDPITGSTELDYPTTGTLTFNDIIALQGGVHKVVNGSSSTESWHELDATLSNQSFTLAIDFPSGNITGNLSFLSNDEIFTAGDLGGAGSAPVQWNVNFTGGISDSGTGPFVSLSTSGDAGDLIRDPNGTPFTLGGALSGNAEGYWIGGTRQTGHLALAFNFAADTDTNGDDRGLAGTLLLDGEADEEASTLTLPDSTLETHTVSWGSWDNPIEENWVVVTPEVGGQVQLQTADYIADVTPTDIANMQGTASYETTLASSFIGSGSAGDVSQVVAGMNVDFNTGAITDGSLQVQVAGSQAWDVGFNGSINAGMVDLNSIGGTLSDPGGIISHSIDANLGGVFTGNNADAFVGGFDMIDQINELNNVNGIYTIER